MKNEPTKKKWYGVDLDGTFAYDNGWENGGAIGEPVPLMLEKVKVWLSEGKEVRVMTARVASIYEDREEQRKAVEDWTEKHLGVRLTVTAEKDGNMGEIWDDRAVQVVKNKGKRVGNHVRKS